MARLLIATLNVLYDPRIAPDSAEHFDARWPRMSDALVKTAADLIALQECHVDWLPRLAEFAESHEYQLLSVEYHAHRSAHLVTLVRPALLVGWQTTRYEASYTATLTAIMEAGGHRLYVTNVHLPLDVADSGERRAVTSQVARDQVGRTSVVVGDWNTLPGLGDEKQRSAFEECGMTLVDWDMVAGNAESPYPRKSWRRLAVSVPGCNLTVSPRPRRPPGRR